MGKYFTLLPDYHWSAMLMPTRDWILMIDNAPPVIVFTLETTLFPGARKSRKLCLGPLLRLNIEDWLLLHLMSQLICSVDIPTIWFDNSGAVTIAANLVLHSKFKHVELDLFFVLKKVVAGSFHVGEFCYSWERLPWDVNGYIKSNINLMEKLKGSKLVWLSITKEGLIIRIHSLLLLLRLLLQPQPSMIGPYISEGLHNSFQDGNLHK
ncbi:hypothetical protein EPI10_005157 [Gossypium australe]|uniref:Uncharacterized protein n=1 Tax=Gossypium australe TaxID=47621 RepID=A0A5B6WMI9_9ROSI|nr:hypothetical protein EPI10_005157 [Gossypium australe]